MKYYYFNINPMDVIKIANFDKALKTLEYDKILIMLKDCASTDGARSKISLLTPSRDITQVRKLLSQTTHAKCLASQKGSPSFGGVKDISESVERAVKDATLTPAELLDIAVLCRKVRGLQDYHKVNNSLRTVLDEIFDRLYANKFLEDKISRCILSEDLIADEASPALCDIRRKIRIANNRVKENLQRYITGGTYSKFLQENLVTMRGGRYVIPVKSEYRSEIKGLVHDTSSSGSTLFIEPMNVVETNNEIKMLEKEEQKEIERILSVLSSDVASFAENLLLNYHNITELAVIFAKSELSFRLMGCEPKISEKREVNLVRARHPLLDKKKIVPINIALGEEYDTLVITGPNTGGKTVSLKTLGLLSLMAQAGLHIPADDSSSVCVFDEILPDIGDEQSIEQSLSTFSSHMTNIIRILSVATPNSLVLFDELGAGTDPVEGAALAMAILEKVRRIGTLCTATTHYAELKAFALETPGVCNASCEFDVNTLKPTYKLIIGTPGKSNAFAISEKLGLTCDIINRAGQLVSTENKRFENVIDKLEENRIEMESCRHEAEELLTRTKREREEFEKTMAKRLERAQSEIDKSREKASQILQSAKASSDYMLAELDSLKKKKDSENFNKELARVRNELRIKVRKTEEQIDPSTFTLSDEDYVLPRPLQIGDKVLVSGLGISGTVASLPDKDGNVSIESGVLKTRPNIDKLRLVSSGQETKSKASLKQAQKELVISTFKKEIDLRGMNGEEAWFVVDRYFDDAQTAGINSVTLVHGKGTGALKSALWGFLKSDKRIESYRLGKYGEGDNGVTIVTLK